MSSEETSFAVRIYLGAVRAVSFLTVCSPVPRIRVSVTGPQRSLGE